MKKFIHFSISFALALLISATVLAQSKLTDEQNKEAKAKYQEYKQQLNLNEDQSKKVDVINTTYFQGIAELKTSDAPKLSKYRKFKSLSSERDKQMKDVLTKDQYKTYKEQQKEMKDEFKERRANRE